MNLIAHVAEEFNRLNNPANLYIAYSGGLDSHVLLYLLAELRQSVKFRLQAIHINHHLQQQSSAWAQHCQTVCEKMQVPLIVADVDAKPLAGESPEASARTARYGKIKEIVGDSAMTALAHHQDDQAETLLLQLFRGAGVRGTAAMPIVSRDARYWRPLLRVSRACLLQFAQQQQLTWVEDDSNQSEHYDRNFIRHQVLPVIQARWPQINKTLARVSALHADSDYLIALQADDLLSKVINRKKNTLALEPLKQLRSSEIRSVLRHWITIRGLALPSEKQLEQLMTNVVFSRQDAQAIVHWAGVEARRYKNQLYIMPALSAFPTNRSYYWHGNTALDLPELQAQLVCQKSVGLTDDVFAPPWRVFYRQGGELCCDSKGMSIRLKRIFQQLDLPTWLRDRQPLIACQEQVIAIAGLWHSPLLKQANAAYRYTFHLEKNN